MKKLVSLLSILLIAFFICTGCQQQEERTYTDVQVQKNKENATKLWNGGDLAIVDTLYSSECTYHNSDVVELNGPEKIKEFVKSVYTSYPDFAVTLDEPLKLKDRVVFTFKATGTNDGPLSESMPPTGKKMSFNAVSISIIENGKITEEWVYYNQLPIYKQLGYKLVPIEEEKK